LNELTKSNEDFKQDTSSDSNSKDSGSDYMPTFQIPTSNMLSNSSKDFSDSSDLNIDQYAHEDEYNSSNLLH